MKSIRSDTPAENTPLPKHPVPRLVLRCLRERHYEIPGFGSVRCRLWCMDSHPPREAATYAVGMDGLGYRRLYCLGEELAFAESVFDRLVRHTVTPFVLGEILEEMTDG